MKLRYKRRPEESFQSNSWNTHALAEVLTGDNTVYTEALEAYVESQKRWVPMPYALKEKWIISDNYSQYFREPLTLEEVLRGYYD